MRCPGQACSVYGGKGHSAKICANVVTVFACEADASGSDSNGVLSGEVPDAFVCDAPGKFFDEPGKWGTNALAWQMEDLPVICDNGASCHMSHSSTGMINYREANASMRIASGQRYPIDGCDDFPLTFRSINSSGGVPLFLCNVAHVPSLSYHLLSLRAAADNWHTYTGNKNGVTVKFKTGETLFFLSIGRLNFLYEYHPGALNDENANAVIAPGPEPSNRGTPVDINAFHGAHANAHEGALRKTAKQMGVTLKGELHECKGCSMAKGIRMQIPSKTHGRAVKRLFRVFVDLGGKKHVASMGGSKYPMIVRKDFWRHARMYFVSHKYDAASAFDKFLADLRVEGTPSEVVIVRSDDGGEFMKGKFGKLCRERKIKQEFTTADSPEYNGVAERGLAMIESAALAARIQASESFPGNSIPEGASLWVEAMNWAWDAYHRTATVGNSGNFSPHEKFYGVTPQSSPIPFLKPGLCKFKHKNKMDPKARECFYLGPARNHPSESKRVLVRTGKVIITRNVTWAHVPLSRPPTVRSTPLVEGEVHALGGREGL